MQLIDTHAHLNFKAFNKDRDRVIKRCLDNNVWLINASSTFNTSKLAVEIAEKYPQGVYASIGLHPIHVKKISNVKSQKLNLHLKSQNLFKATKFKELAVSRKVVAIGETGLDYLYPNKEEQKIVLLGHLELARKLNLPVIFHCRKAHQDLIEVLKNFQFSNEKKTKDEIRGVIHCFSGGWGQAKQYLERGLYLGFNGIIFKMDLDEVIKKTPLERMLIETDCPYLTPPIRENPSSNPRESVLQRNEPIFVEYIARRIAELRGEPFERIAKATTENAKKLFKIQFFLDNK